MSQHHSSQRSILFVDDEAQALKYFAMALADDFDVLTASSADEAEAVLAESGSKIAILVTDQRMPGRSGASLLASVRTTHPDIMRILTTAYSDLEGAIQAVNKGEVFRYITKPWQLDNLRQELRIAMQVFELQRDRDALLTEKFSVKQRLRAADRARGLVTITGALPLPARLHEAVCAYVVDMAALASRPLPLNASTEMWADAEAEASFAKSIARELSELTANDRTDATPSPAVATAAGRHSWAAALKAGSWSTAEMARLTRLCDFLASGSARLLAGESQMSGTGTDHGLALVATGTNRGANDPLLFGPAEPTVVPSATCLLKAYALAFGMHGTVTTTVSGETITVRAELPTGTVAAPRPSDETSLNRRIFQSLERWS